MKKRDRDRNRIQALTIPGFLVSAFLLDEDAFLGACLVAIPVIAYVQWARWKDGARFW